MKVKLSVTGVKEIDKALSMMDKELTHATLGAAHLAAARPLIDKAHFLAPVGYTGNLAESIGGVKTPIKKAGVIGEVQVGPRRSRQYKGHHGHLVEFGTKPRITKKGAKKGVMPAQPYMEPAFEQTKDPVIGNIALEVGKKVATVARRYVKK